MNDSSMFDLIDQAHQMLLDRTIAERELIYHIAKLDPDLRGAIIIAYEFLIKEDHVKPLYIEGDK